MRVMGGSAGMDHLDRLESESIYIIREAYKKYPKLAMLWSVGKDSVLGDSELYYKIDGKLSRGTIRELYDSVSPKEIFRKGEKVIVLPREKVEVLTVRGNTQRKAEVGFGRVTALISHVTDKDTYEISLQGRRSIKVTGDHSLVSAEGMQRLKPIEARRLTPKDYIFCPNQYGFDVDDLAEYKGVKLEDWLLILAGLWVADGCYAADKRMCISTGRNQGVIDFLKKLPRERPIIEKIARDLADDPAFNGKSLKMDLARELGNKYGVSFWSAYNAKKRISKLLTRSDALNVRVNGKGDAWLSSKALVTKLKRLGFKGTGNSKRIPAWLHKASNRQIALFISGYFAGDGSCWEKRSGPAISFSSMNQSLMKALRPLLLRLGVSHGFSISNARSSGFRTKNKKIYQIVICSSQSVKNFVSKITDIAGKLNKIKIPARGRSKYQVSARKVREVKKLPKKRRKVYDVEVEGTHNFIANGIVCHNSTTLVHLTRKAFLGKVPIPVIYIDTGYHFQEMYDFRDKCVKEWGLNLIISKNEESDEQGIGPEDKLKCCTSRKTEALKKTIAKYGFDALLLGIRRDEHGIRAKERIFSPRDQDFRWDYKNQPPELWDQYKTKREPGQHLRVHPLLSWTELDVWRYIKREALPVNPLYFARNGKRYRSLGCRPCTEPVKSNVTNVDDMIEEIRKSKIDERSGRAQDKEEAHAMQTLRALGYM